MISVEQTFCPKPRRKRKVQRMKKLAAIYIYPMCGRIWRICGKIPVSNTMKEFMRAFAILLVLAFVLWTSGCSSSSAPNAQNDAGGVWQANLTGGNGTSSGLSFIAQFTVGSGGALAVSNFQFLNNISSGCFTQVTGFTPTGTFVLNFNSADQLVNSTFSFTVTENGNTLTLTSTNVTGTLSGTSITGGTVTGTWTLQGSGSGCSNTSGNFTMTQSSSSTSSTSST
jgi:hypothetical protein